MKTFINWSGNKSKHINKFIQYIPEFTGTYIEPFVGSGSLLLRLEPEKWIINDINKDLINIWNSIKYDSNKIIKEYKKFGKKFIKMDKISKKDYCRKITYTIEDMIYDYKRATKYLLMSSCAYMGRIIVKNNFYFKGVELNILINNRCFFLEDNSLKNIEKIAEYLNDTNGKIYNTSYEEILKKTKKNDFVFLDPPYIEDHDYDFNYNHNEILDESFVNNLHKEVIKLDNKGVLWLMTQADTPQIRKIFKDYTIKTMKVYRSITKSYVNELIIFNYDI